ncbi:hypothetical protein C8R45DRAFT_797004, partial [Mycena sanguinolenta]
TIQVGGETNTPNGGIYQFMPNSFTATNGSVITFVFSGIPGNHSITQSSFNSPCEPLAGGFDSGWVEILVNTTGGTPLPMWNLTITDDSNPIWFYCKQLLPSPHCPLGMVGAINVQAGSANSFSAFQSAAEKASTVGEGQNGLVGVGASASALPVVPSEFATLFTGASASATAPAGGQTGSTSGTGSASGSSNTNAPSGAVAIGFNSNLLVILG